MSFELSQSSPLQNWTSHDNAALDYEWTHPQDDVLIQVRSSDNGHLWTVLLIDTSVDDARTEMARSLRAEEIVHHPNIARAVAEEYAENHTEWL